MGPSMVVMILATHEMEAPLMRGCMYMYDTMALPLPAFQ
jgi:hypothetical protein